MSYLMKFFILTPIFSILLSSSANATTDSTSVTLNSISPLPMTFILTSGAWSANASTGMGDTQLTSSGVVCPPNTYGLIHYALTSAHAYHSYATQAMIAALYFWKDTSSNSYHMNGNIVNYLAGTATNAWAAINYIIYCIPCPSTGTCPTDPQYPPPQWDS